TTALDVVVQKEILQQIAELKERLGFSILFITHDLSLMLEFCDTIGVLYAGRLCEVSSAANLFEGAEHPYTRGLLDSAPALHGQRHRMVGIKGSPPEMRNPPSGCRFHPRCSRVQPSCSTVMPRLVPIAPGHDCACLLVQADKELLSASKPQTETPCATVQRLLLALFHFVLAHRFWSCVISKKAIP